MKKYLRTIILLIAIVTIFSGAAQVIAPSFVLKFVGGEIDPTTQHFFAIIGMFMVLFGGLMVHALYSVQTNSAAVLWCALQKFGASVAVFIGIAHHLFSPIAASVATFDLLSGILIFIFYRNLSQYN